MNGAAQRLSLVTVTASSLASPRLSSEWIIASATASSTSLPISVSKISRTDAPRSIENVQHNVSINQVRNEFRRKTITTNLPRTVGFQDLAPDHLISFQLVVEILAGSNEDAGVGLQFRGIHQRAALQVTCIPAQQDDFLSVHTRA